MGTFRHARGRLINAAAAGEAAPRQVSAPPPAKLLDKPVERRLHSDRIEASSFLWTD